MASLGPLVALIAGFFGADQFLRRMLDEKASKLPAKLLGVGKSGR